MRTATLTVPQQCPHPQQASLHSKNTSRAHRPVCLAQAGPARPGKPADTGAGHRLSPQHPTPGTLTGTARGCLLRPRGYTRDPHRDRPWLPAPSTRISTARPLNPVRRSPRHPPGPPPADPDDAPSQSGPLRLTRMRATPAPASHSCKSLGDLRPRGVAAGAGLRSTTAASGSPRAGSPS
jgi:hypothetical protein